MVGGWGGWVGWGGCKDDFNVCSIPIFDSFDYENGLSWYGLSLEWSWNGLGMGPESGARQFYSYLITF